MSSHYRREYGAVRGGVGKAERRGGRTYVRPPRKRAKAYPAGPRISLTETKYFDTGINATVTAGSGDWTASEVPCDNFVNSSGTAAAYTDSCLIPTAIGSGYGQVNGNKFSLKKIRVRGRVTIANISDAADVPQARPYRLMLVMDTQPNGLQAQGEDIMADVGAAETMYSFQRVSENPGRFRILKSANGLLQVSAAGTDGTNTNSVGFDGEYFSFQWMPRSPVVVNIKSGNATPTVAGTVTCNVFLLLHGGGTGVIINAASRVYYFDH